MDKPSLPSGTRDFTPETMGKRQWIMQTIEKQFRLFGFEPIETPAMENLKTLTGKYGVEGDQLLFKILNNGDFLTKAQSADLEEKNSKKVLNDIAEKGLRYDLTVPLARFVTMNRDKIQFPFKRYQMQPVWRADRPQKGRYREFWQCDADVVGSKGIQSDADLALLYNNVFEDLGLLVIIRINNRKIFDAFEEYLGGNESLIRFLQCIDKFDKIGKDGVEKELHNQKNALLFWNCLFSTITLKTEDKLKLIEEFAHKNNINCSVALDEIKAFFQLLNSLPICNKIELDFTLARGLSYYTGTVYEVIPQKSQLPENFSIGSIGGGGRYDNLTELFGLKDMPGVGISFGLDRIFDTLEAANILQKSKFIAQYILFCPLDELATEYCFHAVQKCRKNNLSADIYANNSKLKKQLDFANNKQLKWAAIAGSTEMDSETFQLKNLITGEQKNVSFSELINTIRN